MLGFVQDARIEADAFEHLRLLVDGNDHLVAQVAIHVGLLPEGERHATDGLDRVRHAVAHELGVVLDGPLVLRAVVGCVGQ